MVGGIVVKRKAARCTIQRGYLCSTRGVNFYLRGTGRTDVGGDGVVTAVPTAYADAWIDRVTDTGCRMTGQTVVLMMGFTGVGTGVANTAVACTVTGEAVIGVVGLAAMTARIAGTAVTGIVADIAAMGFVVGLAGVRTVGVAFVGAGRIIGTTRHPALAANIADGGIAISDTKTAGAVMLVAADGICHSRYATNIVCITRCVDLASHRPQSHVGLAFALIQVPQRCGTAADTAFVGVADIVIFAVDRYRVGAALKGTGAAAYDAWSG